MKNDTDRCSDEIKDVVKRYAPDYVAPVLTSQLIQVARSIGLPREAVISSINQLWDLSEKLSDA